MENKMNNIKITTGAALFDGHDVSINIFRKLMQKRGAEVIHLGHNRSVREFLTVALQEDVDAILVSSYQGGHNEFFSYIIDCLKENSASNVLVFGGGGGVILPSEIETLENYGVKKVYHAVDGQKIGIDGIADDIIKKIKEHKETIQTKINIDDDLLKNNSCERHFSIAKQISFFENNIDKPDILDPLRKLYKRYDKKQSLILGITGTGGSGKSSLIDEIINRFIKISEDINIGILAVDPSKRKSGGALLGDRIRYNNIYNDRVYFRSFATRQSASEISNSLNDAISVLKSCGFDIIFVETSGIGQGDSLITDISDHSIYAMTADFGAPSQLDKIDMLELADYIVINKYEKIGSEDAHREVRLNYLRNNRMKVPRRESLMTMDLPIYGTSSNQFNNPGVNRLFKTLLDLLIDKKLREYKIKDNLLKVLPTELKQDFGLISHNRINYLAEIANTVRKYHKNSEHQAHIARKCYSLKNAIDLLNEKKHSKRRTNKTIFSGMGKTERRIKKISYRLERTKREV